MHLKFSGHGIDATPVLRSFIFQLLLQGENFEDAKESLGRFLKNEREVLQLDNREFRELSLLAIFCLEDRISKDQTVDTRG